MEFPSEIASDDQDLWAKELALAGFKIAPSLDMKTIWVMMGDDKLVKYKWRKGGWYKALTYRKNMRKHGLMD